MMKSCLSLFRAASLGLLVIPQAATNATPYATVTYEDYDIDTSMVGGDLFHGRESMLNGFSFSSELQSCEPFKEDEMDVIETTLDGMKQWLAKAHVWDNSRVEYYLKSTKTPPSEERDIMVNALRLLQQIEQDEDDYIATRPVYRLHAMASYIAIVEEYLTLPSKNWNVLGLEYPSRLDMRKAIRTLSPLLERGDEYQKGLGSRCTNPQPDLEYDDPDQMLIARLITPTIKSP